MKEHALLVRNVLRCLDAEIQLKAKETKQAINDDMVIQAIKRNIKQRKASIIEFDKGNRNDLSKKEELEIVVLQHYLPEMMNKETITLAVEEAIKNVGAITSKDMGKVMGALKDLKSKADMKLVNQIVKEKLQSN
jgi:uncharacterized protein YqeY